MYKIVKNTVKMLLILATIFVTSKLSAQTQVNGNGSVGIGTSNPDNSAILDINSGTKGLLIPRMSLSQRNNIPTPAVGLLVYQTDFLSGFYYFDGSQWKEIAVNTSVSLSSEPSWSLTGNSGLSSSSNFIGTTDSTALVFKVNSLSSGLIDFKNANTSFGYRSANHNLGNYTVAIGAYSLQGNNTGFYNVAIGAQSLFNNTSGDNNVALGLNSLSTNKIGSRNVALGSGSGFKSVGNGNIFIGFQAGDNEIGDNKLYIDNTNTSTPLVYGDLSSKRLGINTNTPGTALSIDSKVSNDAGLEFKQLTSNSPVVRNNSQKVLSVNENGKIILVRDSVGTSTGVSNASGGSSYWVSSGNDLTTTPITGNIVANNLIFGTKGMVAWNLLYVDGKDAGFKGFSGLQLASLWKGAPVFNPNGRVLTVDDAGNVILTRDSVGVGGGGASYWTQNYNRLSPSPGIKVVLGSGITNFPDGYNLYVSGGILSERVRVAIPNSDKWADYVFKKDYKLMPISSVEKYIQYNKHLPNVPSAQEFVQKGLDVAESSAMLMEKVEELTLYMIQANKKIEQLSRKLAKLENHHKKNY